MKQWLKIIGLLTAILAGLFLFNHSAFAHERRMVGPYEFVVGFAVEPAFEGLKNGVDLRVSIPGAEGEEATLVEGLESTLQVEVTHVASNVAKVMALRTIFRDPGHYTNDWIPTAPGAYRFRIFGTVEDLAVDETFESGEDTFGEIEANDELFFPEAVAEARELEGAVRGAQTSAEDAVDSAASARTLAIFGMVAGTVGIVVGGAGLAVARRR